MQCQVLLRSVSSPTLFLFNNVLAILGLLPLHKDAFKF